MNFMTGALINAKWWATLLVIACGLITIATRININTKVYKPEPLPSIAFASRLMCAYCIVFVIVSNVNVNSWTYRGVTLPFDNPSSLSLHLCLLISLMLTTTRGEHGKIRILTIILIALAGLIVWEVRCRTGIICLIAIVATELSKVKRRSIIYISLALTFAVCIVVTLCMKTESTSGRMFILHRTWDLICTEPIFGHGSHGFESKYMPLQADFFSLHPNHHAAWLADQVNHPLNEFLYLWVNYGIVAPILLLGIFVAPVILQIRNRHKLGRDCYTLPIIPIFIFSLFSYPLKYPMTWTCLAFIYTPIAWGMIQKIILSKYRYALTALACIFIVMITWFIKQDIDINNLHRKVKHGYARAIITQYDKAYDIHSSDARFLYSYMFAQFQAAQFCNAMNTYEKLRQLKSTYDMELLAGDIQKYAKRPIDAIKHYTTAHQMCPSRFSPLQGVMEVYDNCGETELRDSIARIIIEKPAKIRSIQTEYIRKEAGQFLENE